MNTTAPASDSDVIYPDSDGKRMADNSLQFEWIVTIKGNLDVLFDHRSDVFVAGDNLIYPVRGNNKIRQAPDVYVAIGRPKGHRGSYRVWEEGGIFPQVVFEVWSPENRPGKMTRKREFYLKYGAEEYYVINPEDNDVEGWIRDGDAFRKVVDVNGWRSPCLGIRFDFSESELTISYPDRRRFLTFVEFARQVEQARQNAEAGRLETEAARRKAEGWQKAVTARQEAETVWQKNGRLRELLRAAGIDPDKLSG